MCRTVHKKKDKIRNEVIWERVGESPTLDKFQDMRLG